MDRGAIIIFRPELERRSGIGKEQRCDFLFSQRGPLLSCQYRIVATVCIRKKIYGGMVILISLVMGGKIFFTQMGHFHCYEWRKKWARIRKARINRVRTRVMNRLRLIDTRLAKLSSKLFFPRVKCTRCNSNQSWSKFIDPPPHSSYYSGKLKKIPKSSFFCRLTCTGTSTAIKKTMLVSILLYPTRKKNSRKKKRRREIPGVVERPLIAPSTQ